jgi:TetR/AcrR family transcriptional repressor of nem operon
MRVSRQDRDAGHERIVTEASRLLRRRGVEATGVAGVMTAAGRTHGGFYRHFPNKQALVMAAMEAAFDEVLGRPDAFGAFYLSDAHLRHPERGCPIAALGSDVARQPAALKRAFGTGVRRVIARLTGSVPERGKAATRHLAILVGAIVMARASDPATAAAILDACRSGLGDVGESRAGDLGQGVGR